MLFKLVSMNLTVWHICGVAMNFEVDQKTLARPQEMLVIFKYLFIFYLIQFQYNSNMQNQVFEEIEDQVHFH